MNLHNFMSLSVLVCTGFLLMPGIVADNQSGTYQVPTQVDLTDGKPGFEIRIVSPEMLDNVRNNHGSQGIPLKVVRGLYIGVLTPGILYLRGDLNEEEFPMREVIHESSEDKVGNHLIDITFGRDNAKTDLFVQSPEYLIWLDAMYKQEDLHILNEYIDLLNDLSQTVRFEDEKIALPSYQPNYVPNPYVHYKISFIDKDYFKEKLDDRDSTQEQILKGQKGQSVALVRKDHLFILSDLQKEERAHLLIKGLLFSMGFHGESPLKDSFFNPGNTRQTNLSVLDKEAVRLMYGGRLQSGLDVDGIKKALGIESKD